MKTSPRGNKGKSLPRRKEGKVTLITIKSREGGKVQASRLPNLAFPAPVAIFFACTLSPFYDCEMLGAVGWFSPVRTPSSLPLSSPTKKCLTFGLIFSKIIHYLKTYINNFLLTVGFQYLVFFVMVFL